MHTFTTDRLLIRPLAQQDKSLYISLYTDAKIMRNIGEPLSEDAAEKAFNKTLNATNKINPKVITWAIVTLDNDESIGIQALNWQKSQQGVIRANTFTAEIGIMLLPIGQGKAIPKEATGAIIEYGFSTLPLTRINACYAKRNLIVGRIAKGQGFTLNVSEQPEDDSGYTQYIDKENWKSNFIKTISKDIAHVR